MSVFDTCRKLAVPALIKRTCPLIFLFLLSLHGVAQTNIWGIVNTYRKVIQVIPSKSCLRVDNPIGLVVNKRVMVVQMKGATINTNNTSAFGDTTALIGAGNYEIGTICYIIGDSIFLFHDLLNTYDSSAKVQLVQFAEYTSAIVTDTVKALSWDSTAGTGGVIAIYAEQNITLNAPIYADSSGYSGGIWYNNNASCSFFNPAGTGWAYDITANTSSNGAYKGESVANISLTQNSAKGAPANGGGGGNNHNNSGGGGANLTAGGIGGGTSSSSGGSGCTVTNNWGRGGRALNSWNGVKIFSGGGGGAGHANNGSASFNYGGNGGGLIFIWCDNLIGNNFSISANGGKGGASASDGAGGGGGGGTIIMHSTNYTGNVSITANGGNGGQSDDGLNFGYCFGGGGGGSGGAIYFTGPTPAVIVTITGGLAGAEINRDPGCNAAVPATAGTNGSIIPNYTFSRSFDPAGYCQMLLPSKLIYFNGRSTGQDILLNWRVDHPEFAERFIVEKKNNNNDWIALASVNASNNSFDYSASDLHAFMGNNFYRLKVIEKNGTHYLSEIRKIWFGDGRIDFTIYPNPSPGKIYINGNLAPGELLQLIDIHGRIVWQTIIRNNHQESIITSLQPGIYLVRHHGITKKLVIY